MPVCLVGSSINYFKYYFPKCVSIREVSGLQFAKYLKQLDTNISKPSNYCFGGWFLQKGCIVLVDTSFKSL